MKKALIAAALVVLLNAACNKVSYLNSRVPGGGETVDTVGHFFLFGLIGTKDIAAYQMCPKGVASVQSRTSIVTLFLTLITAGLYAPRHYEIECGS